MTVPPTGNETVAAGPVAAGPVAGRESAAIDADLDAAATQTVATAARWAREFVAPQSEIWESERRFAHEAFASAADHGLTALVVPLADGGAGLNQFALARVLEEIAAVDLAVAFSLVCHNNLANTVARLAPPKMREANLPDLVSGKKLGAFLLTEPEVGSDAAAISVSARRDGDSWELNGEKAWVTNGTDAQLLSVYVQTDPDKGHRGIAAFLLDASAGGLAAEATASARPGIIRHDGYQLFGGHAMGTNGFEFNKCLATDDEMMVPVGEGFGAAMSGIDLARVLVSAMCCGMLRTALETAVSYVRQRQAFGGRIADLQGVRFLLADVATDLEAARLLAYRAAAMLTAASDTTSDTTSDTASGTASGSAKSAAPAASNPGISTAIAAAHAKKFATRVTEQRISDCMQVMGAAGARRDHPLPRHLATARLTHYLDGATEIQNVVISRSLLD